MRTATILFLTLALGCGKATLADDDGGDGDGDDGGAGCDCTDDQVCIDDVCEDLAEVAVPEYATRWPDVTGWLNPSNNPIRANFVAVDVAGVTYECRTGHRDVFAALPFAACDGADGTGTQHIPMPSASMEEGHYRSELRLAVGTWTSDPIGFDFYAHHSLDATPRCAPASTDDAIFAAADLHLAHPAAFPDSTVVTAPEIHLPFTNIIKNTGMNETWGGVTSGGNFDVDVLTLRRRFVLSADRTLLLVQRTYESRMARDQFATGTCRNRFRFGNYGLAPRRTYIDCENFVLNSRGQGICIVPGEIAPRATSDIGWVKLLRHEAFSNKGLTETCVSTPLSLCWEWYLFLPD